jgi:Uncharacterized protein conserved in bacteria (DUF2059)
MSRRLAVTLAGLVFVAATAAAQTAPSPAERARLVDQVLRASGERAAADGAAKDIAGMVAGALAGVGDAHDTERIIEQTIDGDRLYRLLAEGVEREFDAGRLSRLLAWLETPFGRRVVQLEVEAARASADEIAAFSAREGDGPSAARTRLLERLDEAATNTESTLEILDAVRRGIVAAASPGEPRAPRGTRPPLPRALVDAGRAQTLQHSRFAYRQLGDTELQEYVAFMEQEGTRWFSGVMRRAASDAVETLVARAARRVLSRPPREERRI